ncbi:hypothetical protein PG999_002071 [Apiospora kogelbergensis]|uniref:Uncharacterized protein n=1 Tax=Apiospora kogelbergensis TaxID=1337665 RepID=A0AAW0R7B3_9PEZI
MTPKKTNSSGTAATAGDTDAMISVTEFEYLKAYFTLCTAASKPEPINIEALGAQFGLKDRKNVMQRFNRLADKFGWFKAEMSGADGSAPTASKKASGRKKKAAPAATTASFANEDGGFDDSVGGPSPAKKRKVDEDVA